MATVNDWIAQSRAAMGASKNAALGNYRPATTTTTSNIDYAKFDPTKGRAGIAAQTSTSTPTTSAATSPAARAAQIQQQYSAKYAQQAASTPTKTSTTGSVVAQAPKAVSAAPATTTAAKTVAPTVARAVNTTGTTPAAIPAVAQPASSNVDQYLAAARAHAAQIQAIGAARAAAVPTDTATPVATTPTAATPAATTETTPAAAATAPSESSSTKSTSRTETLRSTPTTYTPTGLYDQNNLDAYNKQREADLQALYAAALQNTQAGLKTAYDQNMSDAEAARDRISPQYQQSMNAMSAEYERQRRNNNMQAAMNGLNTGAGSQMALAQSANYQSNQAGLAAKENEALNEANRRILDLQNNYQNAAAEAIANNNYKLAAAMLDAYQNAYNRQMNLENTNYQRSLQNEQQNYTRQWNEEEREYSRGMDEAAQKAQYGDFSGYSDVYGSDVAKGMEAAWALQNPQQAWASGKISSADYYALTGRMPSDPNSVASRLPGGGSTYGGVTPAAASTGSFGGYSGGLSYGGSLSGLNPTMGASWRDYLESNGNSRSSGTRSYRFGGYSSGGRGYSSSRDRAYTGPAGYYDTAGNFVVPDANGNVAQAYGSKLSQAGVGARDINAYNNAVAAAGGSSSSAPAATTNDSGNSWGRDSDNTNNTNPLVSLYNNTLGKVLGTI